MEEETVDDEVSKTMRRIQRGDVMVEIPLDLQIEILNRLPIKSLSRFKCVSNLWSSLIRSKGYLFASPPRLYISSRVKHNDVKFELLSFSIASTSKKDTVFDLDLTKQGFGGYDMVALRGLILYYLRGETYIYNPTTGQKVTLPDIKLNILAGEKDVSTFNYFLGYDPVFDQYKVVCTAVVGVFNMIAKHWVFVLEAGSSWKRIEFEHTHFPTSQGLCTKGVIYYLNDGFVSGRIVITFDVRSEEFNMIQVPSVVYEYLDFKYLGIIEYGGQPTIFDYTHLWDSSGLVNLWVLEDAGKWLRKYLILQPCQMHFFPKSIAFEVIGTTQNGEVILKPEDISYPYYILYYDLHKNDVRRVDIRGISKEPFYLALMDTGENIMHLKI